MLNCLVSFQSMFYLPLQITYGTIRFTETVNTIFVSANLRTKWSGCQFEFEEIHLDTFV